MTDTNKTLRANRKKIFISYKRNIKPDHPIAMHIYERLKDDFDVFIDQTMVVGMNWAEQINKEIRQSDYFIILLSEHYIQSEMVLEEVNVAYQLYKQSGEKPVILPIRLAYKKPLGYMLGAYLNQIQWVEWDSPDDTQRVIDEILLAISGASSPKMLSYRVGTNQSDDEIPFPSAQPVPLEMPEGTMRPQSKFYIERSRDHLALQAITGDNPVTITIKAPRQMGKSSLLMRLIEKALTHQQEVVFLDFQLFDREALKNPDVFFEQFAVWLTDKLDIEDKVDEYWKKSMSNPQRLTRYMSRYLLKQVKTHLVIAMDEVNTLFDTSFRSEFFGMLRSWHNARAEDMIWKKLSLFLVTSTEPYQFIDNLNISPFNVGINIELEDFNIAQVHELNRLHGECMSISQINELMQLLNGHPYLTRRGLYLVANKQITAEELFANATEPRGPFGDHLRYHLFRMQGKNNLISAVKQVLEKSHCDDELFFRLDSAGIVRRSNKAIVPRCRLYEKYFKEHLYA